MKKQKKMKKKLQFFWIFLSLAQAVIGRKRPACALPLPLITYSLLCKRLACASPKLGFILASHLCLLKNQVAPKKYKP